MPHTYEVTHVTKHPKGGFVVTFEQQGQNKGMLVDMLRTSFLEWYSWPACVKARSGSAYEAAYESWQTRQRYNPPVEITPPTPRGNPRRCMFCHDDMSGLAAHCLSCGGAMHLTCARESGDKCLTQGCSPATSKKRVEKGRERS